jgi:hypothetical protein
MIFLWGDSQCRMGSPDLQQFAAARPQNLYTSPCSGLHANARIMCIRVANSRRRYLRASGYA